MPTPPVAAAKYGKGNVALSTIISGWIAKWLRPFSRRRENGMATLGIAVPFDLARCEFYYNGTKFRIVFAPNADVTRLNETLPPADWMELIYVNEYGSGVFQVQTCPADSSLKAGCVIAGVGLAQEPVEGPLAAEAAGDDQNVPLGLAEV